MEYKKKLCLTQAQMCSLLFDIPQRTFQSWIKGEKVPPKYIIKLILKHLEELYIKNKT